MFDAVTTVFATAGTGGFAITSAGMAAYSPYIQWVVAVFMALFGVNFGMYFLLIFRKWGKAFRFEEVRHYAWIILGATAIIFFNIYSAENGEVELKFNFYLDDNSRIEIHCNEADQDTRTSFDVFLNLDDVKRNNIISKYNIEALEIEGD